MRVSARWQGLAAAPDADAAIPFHAVRRLQALYRAANLTLFYGEKHGALNRFKVATAAGLAVQVGFDYMLDKNWGLNVDVKKLYLRTNAKGMLGAVPVRPRCISIRGSSVQA